MAGKSPFDTARAGLFDRLVDHDPDTHTEKRPLRTMTKQELYASVHRELGRLLNSRCPFTTEARQDRERSVIDYGVPDFSFFTPQNVDDQKQLGVYIKETVEMYEPRLKEVRVQVEEYKKNRKALLIRIDGILTLESISEPVSFPVILEYKGEKIEIHGAQ